MDTLEGEMDAVQASVSNAATKSEVSSVSSSVSSLQSKVNSAFTSADYDDSTQMLKLTSASGTSSVGPIGGGSSGGKTFTPTTQSFNSNMSALTYLNSLPVGTLCSIFFMPIYSNLTISKGVCGGTLTGILRSKSSSEAEFYYLGGTFRNGEIMVPGALNYNAPSVFWISQYNLTINDVTSSKISGTEVSISSSHVKGVCITTFS